MTLVIDTQGRWAWVDAPAEITVIAQQEGYPHSLFAVRGCDFPEIEEGILLPTARVTPIYAAPGDPGTKESALMAWRMHPERTLVTAIWQTRATTMPPLKAGLAKPEGD